MAPIHYIAIYLESLVWFIMAAWLPGGIARWPQPFRKNCCTLKRAFD
jgi:hypothetical protein